VSGGEGQRVRFGRALTRRGVRLVILDEPFRGLDREQRRTLLQRARQVWSTATLLCITHDVGSTQAFDRVLVVEDGRIIEDGAPASLTSRPETRYRALLDAEAAVHEGLWSNDLWRRLHLVEGRVHEEARLRPTPGGLRLHAGGG
jgi:ATP-binding cassette subfamily B protein